MRLSLVRGFLQTEPINVLDRSLSLAVWGPRWREGGGAHFLCKEETCEDLPHTLTLSQMEENGHSRCLPLGLLMRSGDEEFGEKGSRQKLFLNVQATAISWSIRSTSGKEPN